MNDKGGRNDRDDLRLPARPGGGADHNVDARGARGAVDVDTGCGMMAARTSLVASDLPDNLEAIRSAIEQAVPHGRVMGRGQRDHGSWGSPAPEIVEAWAT